MTARWSVELFTEQSTLRGTCSRDCGGLLSRAAKRKQFGRVFVGPCFPHPVFSPKETLFVAMRPGCWIYLLYMASQNYRTPNWLVSFGFPFGIGMIIHNWTGVPHFEALEVQFMHANRARAQG